MIDSGTVYHFWLPTFIDGSTTSPNISRATGLLLVRRCAWAPRRASS
jgi:hypothetical protein